MCCIDAMNCKLMMFLPRVSHSDPCGPSVVIRSSVDRGGTQAVPARIAESGKGWLERHFEELCEDSDAHAGGESCPEVLSPPEQPQSPSPPY